MTGWLALLGWPAIALSAILSVIGISRHKEYLVVAAVLPVIPIGFYIFDSPLFWWLPVTIPLALLLLSWFIRRSPRKLE